MSELYRLARDVTERLERNAGSDPISLIRAKGELATKAGFLVTLVGPNDPDDAAKLLALRRAATDLGILPQG